MIFLWFRKSGNHCFFGISRPVCPKHNEDLVTSDPLKVLKSKVKEIEKKKLFFFLEKEKYIQCFGEEMFPSRSLSSKTSVQTFKKGDPYWELFRIKGNELDKIKNRLKEMKLWGTSIEILVFDETSTIKFKFNTELVCKKCNYIHKNLGLNSFGAFNPVGACKECKGHGNILKYDPLKLVPNDLISLEQGALYPLKHKRFKGFHSQLNHELHKKKYYY